MADPWIDLSWTFLVIKSLKLDSWKDISWKLTRTLDLVIIVNICPATGLLKSFLHFTFHRKIMYEICGEKTNFSPLILRFFSHFFSTRAPPFF